MIGDDEYARYEQGYLLIRLKGNRDEHELLLRGLVQVLRGAYVSALRGDGTSDPDTGYVESVFNLLEVLLPSSEQLAKDK